jgi:hypothetical protein
MDRVPNLLSIASGFIPDVVKANHPQFLLTNRTPFGRLRTFAARKPLNN